MFSTNIPFLTRSKNWCVADCYVYKSFEKISESLLSLVNHLINFVLVWNAHNVHTFVCFSVVGGAFKLCFSVYMSSRCT